jgi:hypothetical protein
MKSRSLKLALAIITAVLFAAVGLYAASAPDVIQMNNKGFAKHRKGIVTFGHAKHSSDYKLTCGECHHDDQGKPRDLKDGDPVKGCGECHKEFGKLAKADKKMKKAEKVKKYYEKAIHANCVGCHKKIKKGPKKCKDCHPKKKK